MYAGNYARDKINVTELLRDAENQAGLLNIKPEKKVIVTDKFDFEKADLMSTISRY